MNLYHITSREAWIDATRDGIYAAPSLASEGFIHCSTAAQVLPVARHFYRGETNLVLLVIDTHQLTSALKWEPTAGGPQPEGLEQGTAFPHVYGPIALEAVIQTLDFGPDTDGEFTMPSELAADKLPGQVRRTSRTSR
jgi:uncharacterized protein (DUF952 family)